MKEKKKSTTINAVESLHTTAESDIDYSDIAATDEHFWQDASLVIPKPKRQITLRIDDEIIEFFKREGAGYQSRINAVLKHYVDAQKR